MQSDWLKLMHTANDRGKVSLEGHYTIISTMSM